MSGSSPLARGLRRRRVPECLSPRIIPARAGFTGSTGRRRPSPADHPRSRGVYAWELLKKTNTEGSSPLARGLLPGDAPTIQTSRIIPARAGFTRATCDGAPQFEDHPRSRGVYSHGPGTVVLPLGSSPLARGLPPTALTHSGRMRIIPARAGFTAWPCACRTAPRDHPRSRGVYPALTSEIDARQGSSPLARGLHLAIGVIPTVGHPTRGRSPSLVT